jgi:hypothetical protein
LLPRDVIKHVNSYISCGKFARAMLHEYLALRVQCCTNIWHCTRARFTRAWRRDLLPRDVIKHVNSYISCGKHGGEARFASKRCDKACKFLYIMWQSVRLLRPLEDVHSYLKNMRKGALTCPHRVCPDRVLYRQPLCSRRQIESAKGIASSPPPPTS